MAGGGQGRGVMASNLVRLSAGPARFDPTAKPVSTPSMLAERLGAALSKSRTAPDPSPRDGLRAIKDSVGRRRKALGLPRP